MEREFSVQLPEGTGYIAVDRWVNGIAGGGLRVSPSVDLPELRRLARTMSLKWALLGLPFGGCKLGIRIDPASPQKAALIQAFAEEAKEFVENRIFTGPDMGTAPRDLKPFFETMGQDSYDVTTKRLSGSGQGSPTPRDRYRRILATVQDEVTGKAVAQATRAAWQLLGRPFEGATVAIQGYGAVGKSTAEELDRLGARLVAIADEQGCLQDLDGLEVAALRGRRRGLLSRRSQPEGTRERPREAWLETPANIAIPAAVVDAINLENVGSVHAQLVVEAANIPVSREAEVELHRRGILVLPDFLVNGGLAAVFGLCVTEDWASAEAVTEEASWRIVSATKRVVSKSLSLQEEPRQVAEAIVRAEDAA